MADTIMYATSPVMIEIIFFAFINPDLSVCISFALYFILQRIRRPARHIVTRIEALDGLQVIIREGKVEEVDVLYHPFLVGSLWNDDDIVLSQEL